MVCGVESWFDCAVATAVVWVIDCVADSRAAAQMVLQLVGVVVAQMVTPVVSELVSDVVCATVTEIV
jgi:hypothetical protein